jgi:dihydroneopterin aldolase
VTDRIVLANMQFEGTHGVLDEEQQAPQPFEVDLELHLDLAPAGRADDLTRTADYRRAFDICRDVIEGPTRQLIETLAERIAAALLAEYEPVGVAEVVVRIRKPAVMLPGVLDSAAVEITRQARAASATA